MIYRSEYDSLSDSLILLPVPHKIKIGLFSYDVPKDVDELTENITYGQRLFLTRPEPNDFGVILRVMDGYFYPVVRNKKWDEQKALLFGKKVLNLRVKDLYPVAMHLITLVGEMATKESKLLSREPSPIEKAAGIDKLSIYSELSAIDFLRDTLKKTESEVMLTPYNDCLVRFMQTKEFNDYQERYQKLINEPKPTKK